LKLARTDEDTIYNLANEFLLDNVAHDNMTKASNPSGDGEEHREGLLMGLEYFAK